jgi:chaperonin GroEL (HSP60 family)
VQAVTSGANPVSIKRGIDKTCTHLVSRLQELARDVKGTEDIRVGTRFNVLIGPSPSCACRSLPAGRLSYGCQIGST